jgi:hypothetical protein
MPQELAEFPDLPYYLRHVWDYFLELHAERGGNGFGLNPIRRKDIKDWEECTGIRLEGWELRAIRAADAEFMKSQAEAVAIRSKRSNK